jgi:hypothetical protein
MVHLQNELNGSGRFQVRFLYYTGIALVVAEMMHLGMPLVMIAMQLV